MADAIERREPVREALRRRAEANLRGGQSGTNGQARVLPEGAVTAEMRRLAPHVLAELSRRIEAAERRLVEATAEDHLAELTRRTTAHTSGNSAGEAAQATAQAADVP